jgi:predicted short-subunit dehydrogenase-like oxidoreductase (DUF2520 family)
LIDTTATSLRFAVIGAGRLGASLALALRARGLWLVAFTAHSAAGRFRAQGWLGGPALSSVSDAVAHDPDLYLIAVPDQALPEVAAELGGLLAGRPPAATAVSGAAAPAGAAGAATIDAAAPAPDTAAPDTQPDTPRTPAVAHTSGATSVAALLPCERAGATTLVFHPLQTFSDPLTGCDRFRGTAIAVTPSGSPPDPAAADLGFRLADLLGAKPFLLADDKRALYHVAATFACNYLVTLEHHAQLLFIAAGLPRDEALSLFLPLVKATLDNVEAQGPVEALTGPLSRGDVHTIAGHLAALATDAPQLLPAYRVLGLATLDLVRARVELGTATIDELTGLLTAS